MQQTSSVASRTIVGHRSLCVTVHAPRHLYLHEWSREGCGHCFDITMASRAIDLREFDVPAVGEIGMVRHLVDLLPGNQGTAGNISGHLALFWIVSLSVGMTIATHPNVWNGGPCLDFSTGMAIQTGHSHFRDVLLVVVGDGLAAILLHRASVNA